MSPAATVRLRSAFGPCVAFTVQPHAQLLDNEPGDTAQLRVVKAALAKPLQQAAYDPASHERIRHNVQNHAYRMHGIEGK